jgi:endonuclease YncB( thermonuclease family)
MPRPGTGLALRPGMTKIIPALLLGLAIALGTPVARADDTELRFGPCAAVRVLDGVTADLVCRGRIMPVRLRNVTAPQSGQAGYAEAARGLAELLRARELYIAIGGGAGPVTEPDGRLSVYLYDKGGANQNVVLVLLGWGSYDSAADSPALDRSFRAAQDDARNDHRALWTVQSFSASRAP